MLVDDIKDISYALAILPVFTTILANNSEKRASDILDEYIATGNKVKLSK